MKAPHNSDEHAVLYMDVSLDMTVTYIYTIMYILQLARQLAPHKTYATHSALLLGSIRALLRNTSFLVKSPSFTHSLFLCPGLF